MELEVDSETDCVMDIVELDDEVLQMPVQRRDLLASDDQGCGDLVVACERPDGDHGLQQVRLALREAFFYYASTPSVTAAAFLSRSKLCALIRSR